VRAILADQNGGFAARVLTPKRLNPKLRSFAVWLERNKERIPLE
jgi:hypothetical protein